VALIAAAVLTLVQLADLVTAKLPSEVHPVGAALLAQPGYAMVAKVALISLVCAVAEIAYRKHQRIARLVLFTGIAAGVLGALSNT
jgi:hypothetical protein